jgi:hypothetical protein
VTPAERRALARVSRRAADLAPDLVVALLRAFRLLNERLPVTEVERLIRAGRITEAVDAAVPIEVLERALDPATQVLTDGTLRNARIVARDLPLPRGVVIEFGVLNPRILDAVRTLDTTSLRTLAPEVRQAVRETIEAGLRSGVNPRTMARSLTIGLAPNQAEAVRNYRRALETGDLARARRYALADGRFGLANLTPEKVDRMVAAYERRMVAFNAETHARTAALDAQKLGQRMAWDEAKASGALGDAQVLKRWVTTLDGRERPEHNAMHGTEVPLDQPYPNGQMYPGEGEYNCRCGEVYRVARPSFALAA